MSKMAKRRKRARVGSASSTLMKVLGIVAGATLGNIVDTVILPKVNDTMVSVGEGVVGFLAAEYGGGGFVSDMGLGMIADGSQKLIGKALTPAVKGLSLNRRPSAVGSYGGGGKMNAETSFEIV
jgi:hypothetical protein